MPFAGPWKVRGFLAFPAIRRAPSGWTSSASRSLICLDILGPDWLRRPERAAPVPLPRRRCPADFPPHLASLACLFVRPPRRVHAVWTKRRPSILSHDEFCAVVDAERGVARLQRQLSVRRLPTAGARRAGGGTPLPPSSRPTAPSTGCALDPSRSVPSSALGSREVVMAVTLWLVPAVRLTPGELF